MESKRIYLRGEGPQRGSQHRPSIAQSKGHRVGGTWREREEGRVIELREWVWAVTTYEGIVIRGRGGRGGIGGRLRGRRQRQGGGGGVWIRSEGGGLRGLDSVHFFLWYIISRTML